MKNFCIILLAFIWLNTVYSKDFTAEEILTKTMINYDKVSAMSSTIVSTTVYTSTTNGKKDKPKELKQEMKYWFKKPDKVRIEISGMFSQIMVMKEGKMYIKDPATNKVVEQSIPNEDKTDMFNMQQEIKKMLKETNITVLKITKEENKKMYILEGVSKEKITDGPVKTRMWIEDNSWVMRKIKTYNEAGEELANIEMEYEFLRDVWLPSKMITCITTEKMEIKTETIWQNLQVNLKIPDKVFELE